MYLLGKYKSSYSHKGINENSFSIFPFRGDDKIEYRKSWRSLILIVPISRVSLGSGPLTSACGLREFDSVTTWQLSFLEVFFYVQPKFLYFQTSFF